MKGLYHAPNPRSLGYFTLRGCPASAGCRHVRQRSAIRLTGPRRQQCNVSFRRLRSCRHISCPLLKLVQDIVAIRNQSTGFGIKCIRIERRQAQTRGWCDRLTNVTACGVTIKPPLPSAANAVRVRSISSASWTPSATGLTRRGYHLAGRRARSCAAANSIPIRSPCQR
jgi:hypothetical protein